MATIQPRKNADGSTSYRAIIRTTAYKGSQTFASYDEALFWAAAIEKRIAEKLDIIGGEVTLATTVRRMLTKFIAEVTPAKRGAKSEVQMLNALLERFTLFDKTLAEFGPRDLEIIRDARLKGSDKYSPVSPGTVRRELGMLSGAFSHAIKKWHVALKTNPVSLIDRPREPAHRTRRVPLEDRKAMCDLLGYVEGTTPTKPAHWVAWAFCFALETAMRRGEILSADWQHYNALKRRLHIPTSKNGEARNVPISARARRLLEALDAKTAGRIVPVETAYFQNLWNNAKKDTPLAGLHFHDARHEATTQFAKVLHNVLELASVTGHKDLKMLAIYFNPEAEDLADLLDAREVPERLAA